MRKVSVVSAVLCWTLLWCVVHSQSEEYSDDDTLPDLDELQDILHKENLLLASLQRNEDDGPCKSSPCDAGSTKCVDKDDTYYCKCLPNFELKPGKETETNQDECIKSTNCKTDSCPSPSTICKETDTGFYCACAEGFRLKPTIEEKSNKEACLENCKENSCPSTSTTCKVSETGFYCACKEGFKVKPNIEVKSNKEECLEIDKCADGTAKCPKETTCVSKLADYYCKCKVGFKPKKGKKEDNKDTCIKKTVCDDENMCDGKTNKCIVKKVEETEDYYCQCLNGYRLKKDVKEKENKDSCLRTCLPNPCKNGGICDNKNKEIDAICTCPATHTGKVCDKIKWCENKEEKCGTNTEVECELSSNGLTGVCKCQDKTQYFNYMDRKCKHKSKCFETVCKKNENCDESTEKCTCKDGYSKKDEKSECLKDDTCKKTENLCGDENADCGNTDNPKVVKCACKSNFYLSEDGCKSATCLLKNLRKDCENCPDDMKYENKICKTPVACTKDCGQFGWCYKAEGENEEPICKCLVDEAEVDTQTDKCVLLKSVCASGVLAKDKQKCECKGQFKQAADGITCLRRMCADTDVQEECAKINAECVDNWGPGKGFECKCREQDGYTLSNGVCADKCSTLDEKLKCIEQSKICFLGERGTPECRCPPGILADADGECGTKTVLAKSTYFISDLPVLKAKYMKNSVFDVNALYTDVIKAMEITYQNLEFARIFNYRIDNDLVLCTVWLQFKIDAEQDYQRIDEQKLALTGDQVLLPPSLILKAGAMTNIRKREAKICEEPNDPFCGGSECKEGKCSCPAGFKIVDYTIKKYNNMYLFKCEDINECKEGTHACSKNSECINTDGSFFCKCKSGFKTKDKKPETDNKEDCIDVCDSNPCGKGTCKVHDETKAPDCSCPAGEGGSFCDRKDVNFAGASKKTVVVGAVLGSILGIMIILIVVYILRQRKKSYSEDFTPCPPRDNAEMMERRGPMRKGVSNPAYQ